MDLSKRRSAVETVALDTCVFSEVHGKFCPVRSVIFVHLLIDCR